jgi:glycosyltransferase WbpL
MPTAGNVASFAILGGACLATVGGTRAYRSFAVRRGILANPNFRSLHERPIPRGGGIVFSLSTIAAFVALGLTAGIDPRLLRALVVGGTAATVFGFVDDAMHIGAKTKLLFQGALAAWTLLCFGGTPLVDLPFTPRVLDLAVSWIALVWMINFYNFIDGIDGMAATGAILISATAILVLVLSGGDPRLLPVFGAIAVCSAGFLVFNWPPASIFMGDSGSVFLGFCFGALMAGTLSTGGLSLSTWLVLFGYFAGDTTTTTLLRMFVAERWYGEHRSHAYQNLARIWASHFRVVRGVILYHVLWLTPLAVVSALAPPLAPFCAAMALVPVVAWTLRYGPLLSSS